MTVQSSPSINNKSFSEHMRATLVLGIPLVGAQLAQMLINVTDTVMLGWLGTRELAAGTLAFQTFFIFLIFGLGFGAAMVPLIANALGREDPRSVRRAARMGMWALMVLALAFMVAALVYELNSGCAWPRAGISGFSATLHADRTMVADTGVFSHWRARIPDQFRKSQWRFDHHNIDSDSQRCAQLCLYLRKFGCTCFRNAGRRCGDCHSQFRICTSNLFLRNSGKRCSPIRDIYPPVETGLAGPARYIPHGGSYQPHDFGGSRHVFCSFIDDWLDRYSTSCSPRNRTATGQFDIYGSAWPGKVQLRCALAMQPGVKTKWQLEERQSPWLFWVWGLRRLQPWCSGCFQNH